MSLHALRGINTFNAQEPQQSVVAELKKTSLTIVYSDITINQ